MSAEIISIEARANGELHPVIDGAKLLDDVRAFVRRFCVLPDAHALTAVALWAVHAHLVRRFHTTPRLAILSPEAASGKTRVLEVLDLLVPESRFTLNASPPAIFRTLALRQITILFDEVDSIWNKRGKDDNHEDLRALLNAGYKRGAVIPRCVGPKHDVVDFAVYSACALAGLGDLPETVMSRSVIIRMRRRAASESVEQFRTRIQEPEGNKLKARIAKWAESVGDKIEGTFPDLPEGIVDRPAEVWEPLVAVADAAGGHWPKTAREACLSLCQVAEDRRASLGVRLLGDLRVIFGNADALTTETIIQRLIEGNGLDDDAPWADLHGKPIGKRYLASLLKQYGTTPQKVSVAGANLQGYRRDSLWDAWIRYLPPIPSSSTGQAEHPEHLEYAGQKQLVSIPDVPVIPDVRDTKGGNWACSLNC